MAFRSTYVCEYCGRAICARPDEVPEYCGCPEEERAHKEAAAFEEDVPVEVPMSKAERRERYRIAYHLRGSTWEGTAPYMYQGDLEEGQAQLKKLLPRHLSLS